MLTRLLIAINVVVYVWEVTTGDVNSTRSLIAHGALYGPAVSAGEWWRVVTGEFLHGGLLHIATNMFALYQVGRFVELLYGRTRMGAIYAFGILGAGISVLWFNYAETTVGASGAIFALFGALLAAGLQLGARGRSIVQQSAGIIILNLVLGFTVFQHISNAGHIGGLIAGFLLGYVLFLTIPRRVMAEHAMVATQPVPTDDGTVYEPPGYVDAQAHKPHDPNE